MVRRHCGAQIQ